MILKLYSFHCSTYKSRTIGSKLKIVKYSEKNAIKASAKMDEFSDNHYGDSLDEIMEFLGFKNINSLVSGEEYIYI